MSYFEGFVLAVPNSNKQAYVDLSWRINPHMLEFGAIKIFECWGDDIPEGSVTDYRRAVHAKDDETVVLSLIEWPDKETRDRGNEKMHELAMTDESFDETKYPVPFDGKRMLIGGFQTIVEMT